MNNFVPKDPAYRERVERSVERQKFLSYLGISLAHLAPGEVDLTLPFSENLTQQHGFFHAGATTTLADTAAGYAALTLYPPGTGVLTTEFKMNLLNPGRGEKLVARGRVIKPGRTLTVCRADVYGIDKEDETHIATALLTMITLEGMDD